MCLTFVGRIQTRLLSLIIPLLGTGVMVVWTRNSDYGWLFLLAAFVGLTLDILLYGWLIGFQPRWMFVVLAIAEFLIIKWIVEWPYPLELRLRTRQALLFYAWNWLSGWLTLQMALPLFIPRWSDNGGELRRAGSPPSPPRLGHLRQRREAYASACISVGVLTMPWLVEYATIASGFHSTGFLVFPERHYQVLGAALREVGQAGGAEAWIVRLASWSHTPVLTIYVAAWLLAGFALVLGATIWAGRAGRLPAILLAGTLAMAMTPMPLALAAASMWIAVLFGAPAPPRWKRSVVVWAGLAACLICGLAWNSVIQHKARLDEATWQALTWLRQSTPPDAVIAAPPGMEPAITGLSGRMVGQPHMSGLVYRTEGCNDARSLFRHGRICITAGPRAESDSGLTDHSAHPPQRICSRRAKRIGRLPLRRSAADGVRAASSPGIREA